MLVPAFVLIVVGLVGILWTWLSSNRRLMDSGIPKGHAREAAGTGIVPRWVSAVNLSSWLALVAGVVLLVL